MNRYKKWTATGVAFSILGILVGCGTGHNPIHVVNNQGTDNGVKSNDNSVPINATTSNQGDTQTNNKSGSTGSSPIKGKVLTVSVKSSDRTSLPSSQQGAQTAPVSELRSSYGTIQASTSKKTTSQLQIILTHHARKNVIYADDSRSLKWLLSWQTNGDYLFLNIGEPAPNMTTGDFGGEAVVINLKTKQVALKQQIGMESRQKNFITPTALVTLWSSLSGPGNSIVDYYTSIANLGTDKSVTFKSTTSQPLGQDPYVIGNRVYFASRSNIYFVEIPTAAWNGGPHTPYRLVLRPSVKISS